MAPLNALLAKLHRSPMWLQVHGIEAWERPSLAQQKAAESAAQVTAVSRHTRRRFLSWANMAPHRVRVLPNMFGHRYTPGPKPAHLAARHGLADKKVLLTVSRLATSERYKGHDRVIAALPRVLAEHSDAVYLIIGDGDDRPRLEARAAERGVSRAVRFLGPVADDALVDHYRLADTFVMPSTGEGFGIVFLEAAACGLPVIAGNRDGSVDALAEGAIGTVIDPDEDDDLVAAICTALDGGARRDPMQISRFSRDPFTAHVDELIRSLH